MEERKQKEGGIQREEGWKVGRDALPMLLVKWTLSRAEKIRAPLECQNHTCKSVAVAAISAFAHAREPDKTAA